MPQQGNAQLNVSCDPELKQQFRELAKRNGTTATELINRWITQYIDSRGHNDNLTASNLDNDDSAAAQDVPDRADEIDEIKNILIQQQEQLDQHQQSLDNTKLEQRLERLEKRESENYQAIARLQETYPPLAENTKQLKEAVRELKHETQALKINRASMNDIHNLEVVLEQKIDSQQMDERLAMATMPIWESLEKDETKDYSLLEVVENKSNNDERDQASNNETPKGVKVAVSAIGKEFGVTDNTIRYWFLTDTPPQHAKENIPKIIEKYNVVYSETKSGNKTVEFYKK